MKSKIIQIAAYQTQFRSSSYLQNMIYNNHVIALCEDGSLWEKLNYDNWEKISLEEKKKR